MSTLKAAKRANRERLEPAVSMCREIRNHLERRRDLVCEEITRHPTPIPACDVHFNRLLEERTKIFQELGQLDRLQEDARARKVDIAALEEFIGASEVIGDDGRREIRAAFKDALSTTEI